MKRMFVLATTVLFALPPVFADDPMSGYSMPASMPDPTISMPTPGW